MYLRSIVLCGLLHALALAGPLSQPSTDLKLQCGSCPMCWFNHDGHFYKYVDTGMTWADAELHCLSLGANLVSIHNEDENNFVVKLIENFDPTNGKHWIGFSDTHKEGSWMWSDGSQGDFYAWYKGEPNNHDGANAPWVWSHRAGVRDAHATLTSPVEIRDKGRSILAVTLSRDSLGTASILRP
ncbi:Galactose-specific lectin nattectin [Merluccius polli]|uniref:Galactose-specific lectin nattectin n=1 Tax=Merluccius polli TaxID=89951 RepID=A0AA47P5M5_MERPO|nr:Galactose-specific lectin nattectin [Merluccius polli]